MKKFKLMQILPSLRSGGVEQGTLDVANYLASLDIKNYICSNGGQMLSYLNKQKVEHYNLPVHSKNFLTKPFVASKINNIILKKKIEIIHFRSRAPAWLLPFLKIQNLKTVSTFHNVYRSQNFFKKIYNSQLGKVDKVIAISNFVKKEIIMKYDINPNKIDIIYRGIDTNFFNNNIDNEKEFNEFLKKFNIDLDKKIILFPGRLTAWKGQIEFLQVVEKYKNTPIIFYFVGDDKNKSYLKKFSQCIAKKNLNLNCKILGNLKNTELKMMYKCSNLIISAPLEPEGFGRTISESLAMKKIILAYNFGGAKDQLDLLDGIYKVENKNINEMIFKIDKALNLDESHIMNLGNVARNHVINNFSKKMMENSYLNFYQEL